MPRPGSLPATAHSLRGAATAAAVADQRGPGLMTFQDSLWDAVDNDNGGDGDEPPRRAGAAALEPVPAGQLRQAGGPGDVLLEPGRAGGRGDRGAVPGVRGSGDAGG